MDKIIFLDRDGTLNEEVHYLHRKDDMKLLPGVAQAIRIWREQGYRIVVVTNQAGVARGYYQEADVEALHAYMNSLLRQEGAEIDHFFYCPHHPEHGTGRYRTACRCRKPDIGMFLMAERYYQVDKAHSWMIGDKLIDVEAGRNYGVRTVLVGTGYGAGFHAALQEERQKKRVQAAAGQAGPESEETISSWPEDPASGADCQPENPASGADCRPEDPAYEADCWPENPVSGADCRPENPVSGADCQPEDPAYGNNRQTEDYPYDLYAETLVDAARATLGWENHTEE